MHRSTAKVATTEIEDFEEDLERIRPSEVRGKGSSKVRGKATSGDR